MFELLMFCPALIVVIIAVVLTIRFRKTEKPGKFALAFSVIALVFGISFICFSLFPPEYTGEQGLDYIGQAMAWAMMINAVLFFLVAAYLSFAVAATVFAVKVLKAKDKKKLGIVSIVAAWICGLAAGCLITVNAVSDMNRKKSLSVDVISVALTDDSEGNAAVVLTLEFYNGSKNKTTYLSSVYDEVTQNDKEIYHTPVIELLDEDGDIKVVEPGESVTIRKSYKLEDDDAPVRIFCSSYGGKVVYVRSDSVLYERKKKFPINEKTGI